MALPTKLLFYNYYVHKEQYIKILNCKQKVFRKIKIIVINLKDLFLYVKLKLQYIFKLKNKDKLLIKLKTIYIRLKTVYWIEYKNIIPDKKQQTNQLHILDELDRMKLSKLNCSQQVYFVNFQISIYLDFDQSSESCY